MPRGKPRQYWHRFGMVYMVTCKPTGKVYIGQTGLTYPTTRWRMHIQQAKNGHQTKLHADLREYGESAFEFIPIASAWSGASLDELEKVLISQYQAIAEGYNARHGKTARPKPPEPEPPWTPEREARQRELEAQEDMMYELDAGQFYPEQFALECLANAAEAMRQP